MKGGEYDSYILEQWARVRGRLRAEVGEAAFRSWLKPLLTPEMHRGVNKGILHQNTASRKISRLSARIKAMV